MANVTDPLARPIHGTNPQNLIEYITRQRIYDSQYWKEHLFGCTAADVAEKAALQLQAIGGSYGGNAKPARFLCLVLKMLQIQPEDEIVDELINNENFKYVRALGAFYLRMTGRPADIYEKLEPLLNDYRKLKYRRPIDWELLHMDEFVDQLLTEARVCGIALPRLPKRDVLVESGYLEGPRRSAVAELLDLPQGPEGDDDTDAKFKYSLKSAEKMVALLERMAQDGNPLAHEALVKRGHRLDGTADTHDDEPKSIDSESGGSELGKVKAENSDQDAKINEGSDDRETKKRKLIDGKKKKSKKKKFGSLFKSPATSSESNNAKMPGSPTTELKMAKDGDGDVPKEQSDEYWNEQRAKLGLKPLRK